MTTPSGQRLTSKLKAWGE